LERGAGDPGDPVRPTAAVAVANVGLGTPFLGVTLLAGLPAVSQDRHEASIDRSGARPPVACHLPVVRPVLVLVTVLSIVATFGDFARE
jgi:ABC-type sugar transport system permease subunit